MTDYTIALKTAGPDPSYLKVEASDKVTFSNEMSKDTIVDFSGDSPFRPKASIPVAAGGLSSKKNVNGTRGVDTYTYEDDTLLRGPRSGTIEI